MQGVAAVVADKRPPYGGIDLKRNYRRYWLIAFLIATFMHIGVIGTYYLIVLLQAEEPPVMMVRIMKYSDLGPPPSIAAANTPPPISVSAPAAKPSVGAPVPVPDAEVSAEQTIMTQQEMSQEQAPVFDQEGFGGEGFEIEQDILIDDGPPPDFVPVEKEPVVVKAVEPKYPELAMRAGLEGRVWIKIWVDKEGKPRQAVILKSDAEIFNEPAVKAAMSFVFTPAYMNNGPVSVWVSIPFKFKLADRR